MRPVAPLSVALACLALSGGARAAGKTCAEFRAGLPKALLQDFVEVPEDWKNPAGAKLKIFYYGKKPAAEETPLVFFNGGPGESSHESYAAFEKSAEGRALPLIYVDQRGTGCSSPFPTGNDVAALTRILKYGSTAIVKDAEAIRKKVMSGKKWRAFGQSYGGYIVHRYLEVAPDGLTAAFAHGAAIYQDDGDFTRLRLLAQKRSAELFFVAYPLAKASLIKAKAQITPKTCFQDKNMKICGPAVLDALVYYLGFETVWPDLNGLIQNLAANQKTVLPGFVKENILTERSSILLPASVISLIEAPIVAKADESKSSCDVALGRLRAAGERPETWLFNECRYMAAIVSLAQPSNDALSQTTYIPEPFSLGAVIANLKARPTLKFHLYASKNDPIVPAGAFIDEAKQLGTLVRFRYLKASSHDGFLTEPRVFQDLAPKKPKKKGK